MNISIGDGSMQKNIRDGLCPRCQTQMRPIEVHGHVQCAVCHLVIEECCQERFKVVLMPSESDPDFKWVVWDNKKDKMRYRVTDKDYAEKLKRLLDRQIT